MNTLIETLSAHPPERLAISDEQESLTYAELLHRAEVWAKELPAGGLVLSMLPGGVGMTTLTLACLRRGCALLPVSSEIKLRELRAFVRRARPQVLVGAEGLSLPDTAPVTWDAAQPWFAQWRGHGPNALLQTGGEDLRVVASHQDSEARDWSGVSFLQPTSGSTGEPKLIALSEEAVHAGCRASGPFAARFKERNVLVPVPQFHAMGSALVLEHLLAGSGVIVRNRFLPGAIVKDVEAMDVGLIAANPSYARFLHRLKLFPRLTSLLSFSFGSAPTEPSLLEELRALRPELGLHVRYGLSEAFGALARLDIEAGETPRVPGAVGPLLPGFECAALPRLEEGVPGELCVRGPSLGSWCMHETTERQPLVDANGFLPTGDLAFEAEGVIVLRGRNSQFLKRNGYRIDPTEIEQVLLQHGEVNEAVVVGIPDPLADQRIIAVVEGSASAEALMGLCRQALSASKWPQRIYPQARLPRTAAGKPDRPKTRTMVLEGVINE